jgi:hypothetical protein
MNQRVIAKLIERDVEKLTETWMRQLREDERLACDAGLTKHKLTDQVPQIIKEICQLLNAGELPNRKSPYKAGVSISLRHFQEYRGRDLLRELSLLRVVLFDHLTYVCTSRQLNVTAEDFAQATRIITVYLDSR